MTLWFLGRKHAPPLKTTPELSHEIRNAILGLALERRQIMCAFAAYVAKSDAHIKRIEKALSNGNGGSAND